MFESVCWWVRLRRVWCFGGVVVGGLWLVGGGVCLFCVWGVWLVVISACDALRSFLGECVWNMFCCLGGGRLGWSTLFGLEGFDSSCRLEAQSWSIRVGVGLSNLPGVGGVF